MCDLVHDVKTIFHLFELLTATGNLLCCMSDAKETANIMQFPRHHRLLVFQKRIPDAFSSKHRSCDICTSCTGSHIATLVQKMI